MSDSSNNLIIKHISKEKLNEEIRELEKVAKKVNRLHFIKQIYKGNTVKEASEILDIPLKTCYNCLKKMEHRRIRRFKS